MTEQVKSNQLEIIDTDSNMIEHAKRELKFLRATVQLRTRCSVLSKRIF